MAYWSDDVTNVTNYIATLVASVNVIYERDLDLRLLVGTTFLRVSTTPDPWSQAGTGNADSAKLSEFSNYWSANEGGVTRALAALLSGKQGGANSASGIAWLTSLCNTTYGYSFNQLFKINYLSGDTLILGHEIGHNLGSPHTHCYPAPRPDQCYGSETGSNCYSGATSCPGVLVINGVTSNGTLMSYCHLLGCGATTLVFHPQTVNNYIGPQLSSHVGVCVFPFGGSTPTPTPTRRDADAHTHGDADATPTRTRRSRRHGRRRRRARPRPQRRGDAVEDAHADPTPTLTPTRTPTGRTPSAVPTATPTATPTGLPARRRRRRRGRRRPPRPPRSRRPPGPASSRSRPAAPSTRGTPPDRSAGRPSSGGASRTFTLTGVCGIPDRARASCPRTSRS